MNLSESLRHYANLLEDTQAQYIKQAIERWDRLAGTADVPPKDPNDGLNPNQPPTADWSVSKTERWLLQYGDVRLINKRSRHQPLRLNALPSISIMLQERDWHNFVRYYAIVKFAYGLAERKGDTETAKKIKLTLNRLYPEYKRRRDLIRQREYEQYDMEAKMRRDHPDFYKANDDDGGLEW
jgi:hypothetical protein